MTDAQQSDSSSRKISGAIASILSEDDEIKQMMRELLVDAIVDMRHTIRHGDGQSKAALQRLLLPHLAASATASAGKSDIRETVESIHSETLSALLEGPDQHVVTRVTPTLDD